MRRMAELYGAWIFGVLCTCGLAYWLYRRNGDTAPITPITQTEPDNTGDTDDTVRDDIVAQIRPRFRG